MSIVKTVGIAAAVLATGVLGYGIYKRMQKNDENISSLDEMEGFDKSEDDEEVFDDFEDGVVYG